MRKTKETENKLIVFQAKNGAIELKADVNSETVWATQANIVKLFEKDQSVVSRHIAKIFKDGEVDAKSNMQKMHNANSDKPVVYYSLDVILAVGYRVNSNRAIEFRKWATKTLKQYITQGFAVNSLVIKNNYSQFLEVVEDIKKLIPSKSIIDNQSILELVSAFADTWLSLDAYDKNELVKIGKTKKRIALTVNILQKSLDNFKSELIKKGEATELFGREREKEALAGIVGNVM